MAVVCCVVQSEKQNTQTNRTIKSLKNIESNDRSSTYIVQVSGEY